MTGLNQLTGDTVAEGVVEAELIVTDSEAFEKILRAVGEPRSPGIGRIRTIAGIEFDMYETPEEARKAFKEMDNPNALLIVSPTA